MEKRYSGLTDEVIRILKENPYTFIVTKRRFLITLEAKRKIIDLRETGMSYKQIIEELGYDSEMLGKDRTNNIVRSTLKEAESIHGLHQGYLRTSNGHMKKEEIEQLDYSAASYEKLKNEVIYLREEVDFKKNFRSM